MKLSALLQSLPNHQVFGDTNIEISEIVTNSRQITPGSLFVAISGLTVDSHDFIPKVIKSGAVAIIGEKPITDLPTLPKNISYTQVESSRYALGILASVWFGNPSENLKVIGVTGTEGKTTTCSLIYHTLTTSGVKTGLVSTIGAKIGEESIDTGLHVTNPEALPLQKLLSKMVEKKCEAVVLETTSMGLDQGRVAGVKYNLGVLTNITRDHLDYHKTLENYRVAKAILFKNIPFAVLNKDDQSFSYIFKQLPTDAKMSSYSINSESDYQAINVNCTTEGTEFDLKYNNETINFKTNLLGLYNVYNTLAAIAAARTMEVKWDKIKEALQSFKAPDGRLEKIDEGQKFSVFVDFAHTPNSLKNVLQTLRNVVPSGKKLIALYGSAGKRDKEKRPEMGEAGGEFADITIFTADDPRDEKVRDISIQLATGANKTGAEEIEVEKLIEMQGNVLSKKHVYTFIDDRAEAIKKAIEITGEGDIVALLGKGHEKSLAVGTEEIPWSDQEEARKAINGR